LLPNKTQYLCLADTFGATKDSRVHEALQRLTCLQELVIEEFVTQKLVDLLSSLCFPRLYTLGFQLSKHHGDDDFAMSGNMMRISKAMFDTSGNFVGKPCAPHTNEWVHDKNTQIWSLPFPANIANLSSAFPKLQILKVYDPKPSPFDPKELLYYDTKHVLDSWWMSPQYFPCLKGDTCKWIHAKSSPLAC